ncbi:MAG: amino acid dehydrogenase [Gammaproteobacteria bacterium]|jgi:leucine dehydrogenase|nr:amino acid dehydrogenase [Gammaproteobacteria bacterium]MDH3904973.1 amino acid dehydrogenase [Gammaproteobacteria bacterium]MDH4005855.1 amino acid dehydrogenase [Gammaproteobacteria bacterium]NCF58744.1 amino acid dehydrogenase [Gammaproteobacteria bacterium]
MTVFSNPAFDNHERVLFCRDEPTGLCAIIAIHSTALGPAAGGTRLWTYANDDDALYDVLRLSQGMSYKNAMAGLKFGGGKAVIIKTPDFDASDALFERFGEFVDTLGGDYITAEDVGMSVEIMETIARRTRYVSGLPLQSGKAGGDPSPKTAYGLYCGIQAAAKARLGRDDLEGMRVAVQGVGHVGYHLCKLLHEAGATLVVSDLDETRVDRVCDEFSAERVGNTEILGADVDVLAPCALGAILHEESIPGLKARIIAGGANNQLRSPEDGQRLADAGILYAPDYVINAGGIINVACEYFGDVDDDGVTELVAQIGSRLADIFEEASRTGEPTNVIADRRARKIISGDV